MKIFKAPLLIILFVFIFDGCNQSRYKTQILGEWHPIDAENLEGYHFMENNLCENKLGYFDRYTDSKRKRDWLEQIVYVNEKDNSYQIHFDEHSIINYQGNTTFYEVYKDSLRIYDLSKRTLVNHKIKFLSKDTIQLSSNNDSILNKFVRKNYQLDTVPLFDEIIFSLEGSPATSLDDRYVSIKRNGEVVTFSPHDYNRLKINENEFKNIENRFKKADIETIIANYKRQDKRDSNDSDFTRSSITFVKGNKIVLSFEDPVWNINTKEFLWAYLSALFCTSYNHLEFCKDYSLPSDYLSFFWPAGFFTRDNRMLKLYSSEQFYLLNLINEANKTDHDFSPIYVFGHLIFVSEHYKYETDGRFFRYKEERTGKKVTLDLGFNFIEENNMESQFWKR